MNYIQARWKAVFAFLLTWASTAWAFYQAHQNLTLKQLVTAAVAAVISGAVVHQVKNQEQ